MTISHDALWQIALACLGLVAFLYFGITLTVDPDRFIDRFGGASGSLGTEAARLVIRLIGMVVSGMAGLLLYVIASELW